MGWVKAMWGEWPGYFPTYLLFLHFDYGAALAWPLGFVCFKAVRLSVFLAYLVCQKSTWKMGFCEFYIVDCPNVVASFTDCWNWLC